MPMRVFSSLISWQAGFLGFCGLEVIAQLPLPERGESLVQTTALGVLSIAVVGLFRAIHAMLKTHKESLDKICDRFASQQQVQHDDMKSMQRSHHDDMQGLQKEVQSTRLHCARVLAGREAGDEKREAGN